MISIHIVISEVGRMATYRKLPKPLMINVQEMCSARVLFTEQDSDRLVYLVTFESKMPDTDFIALLVDVRKNIF